MGASPLAGAGAIKSHAGGPVARHAAHALWDWGDTVIVFAAVVILRHRQPVTVPASGSIIVDQS